MGRRRAAPLLLQRPRSETGADFLESPKVVTHGRARRGVNADHPAFNSSDESRPLLPMSDISKASRRPNARPRGSTVASHS